MVFIPLEQIAKKQQCHNYCLFPFTIPQKKLPPTQGIPIYSVSLYCDKEINGRGMVLKTLKTFHSIVPSPGKIKHCI